MNDRPDLSDDLLVGADAIAEALGWRKRDGSPNRRRVYHLAEKGDLPIHRVAGLGLCARRSALRAYFAALDRQTLFGGNTEPD